VIEEPPKPKKQVVARAEKPEKAVSAKSPGRLELAVAPWGEVLVDGKSRGLSPPLRVLEVTPGPHTVEIRNSTFPAHVARIEVKPGEAVRIQHRFR
jgi:serine/threonine-protein kinase